MLRAASIVLAVLLALVPPPLVAQSGSKWFRGNLHVHTNQSDGNTAPAAVVAWYRDAGYDFVALTDHDRQTVTPRLLSDHHRAGEFLLIPGVEVTDRVGRRPVHLNGIGVAAAPAPAGGGTVPDVIRANAARIEAAGGMPIVNHPNGLLAAALSAPEIASGGVHLFEVCCSDHLGGSGKPSTEAIWDAVLDAGHRLLGIAADDAHDFSLSSRDPGSSWVMVRADTLTTAAITTAMRAGDFYATTGVELADVSPQEDGLCLRIAAAGGYGFRTEFIGPGGVILRVDEGMRPCHRSPSPPAWLRARVTRSDGRIAWVQPVWFDQGVRRQ